MIVDCYASIRILVCTCINCFYSKGSNFTLTICLINFYSSFENLNGNLGFAVAVNVLLSIKTSDKLCLQGPP